MFEGQAIQIGESYVDERPRHPDLRKIRERSDAKGKFFFGSLPKRDYTLRVDAPGYQHVERQLRVTRTNNKHCRAKIDVKLGFQVCDTGTYIKGVDKPGDLDAEFDQLN